jgi:hypothetical protein
MPSFSMSPRSRMSTAIPCSLASCQGLIGQMVGVQMLPGRLPRSLASSTPAAIARPCARACSAGPSSLRRLTQKVSLRSGRRTSSFFDLRRSKRYRASCNDHRGLPDPPGDIALFYRQFGQVDGAVEAAGFIELAHCRGQGGAIFLFAELALLAQADQQDAIRFDTGHGVEQQAGPGFALHVATAENVAEILVCRLHQPLLPPRRAFSARRRRARRRPCAAFPGCRFLC